MTKTTMTKTTMQGVTEMAMAKAVGFGILMAPTADAAVHQERMQRVVSWAITRYGAEWAFPRFVALGEKVIETGMSTVYSKEAFAAAR
jgi:hypothetical protein